MELSIFNQLKTIMHKEVKIFCESVKIRFPEYFINKRVLDCGSLDINGNNRYLFDRCIYTGIDIAIGKNVDVVTPVHLFEPFWNYDVVISSEMLEHDCHYVETLQKMFDLTKQGGLLMFTAAGTNRPEHGTAEHHSGDSPMTQNYYCNITVEMLLQALTLSEFSWFEISYINTDIRFTGIKR